MIRRTSSAGSNARYRLRRNLYFTRSIAVPPKAATDHAEVKAAKPEQDREPELTSLREVIVRQKADFDNFRKRSQREKDQVRDTAAETLLTKLLPMIDNVERALASTSTAVDANSVREGVSMILTQFQRTLEVEGLHRVEALHQPFNPTQHDALATEERTDVPENHVCDVLLPGYLYKEKLLRPAMVKVAKAPAGEKVRTE